MIKDIVKAIRNIRASLNIPHSKELTAHVITAKLIVDEQKTYIKALARLEKLDISSRMAGKMEGSAAAVIPGINIYVPLKGIIDLDKEVARLKEKLVGLDVEIEKMQKRLAANQNIPEDVLAEWKGRVEEFNKQKATIQAQIKSLSA